MDLETIQIILIASLTAITCAILGVFLVLRRMALMSDAISHSILLGIVLVFFIVEDLSSPWLIMGAGLTGLLMAFLVESINKTGLVKEDASIGLVFPALFSIGVILINLYAGDVHLDIDAVLVGDLVFAPFNTLVVFGRDIGPKALYVMSCLLALNVLFITIFYKELKLSTFDAGLAMSFGFAPLVLHYVFMGLVSVTAVGAFDAVGSILVVALMIAPPASAFLLTDDLKKMLFLSAGFGVLSAVCGYFVAHILDSSISGCIAVMTGVFFFFTYVFAPQRGMVSILRRRLTQRLEFAQGILAVHLAHHRGQEQERLECQVEHLTDHIRWDRRFATQVVNRSVKDQFLINEEGILKLTQKGLELADTVMES